MGPLISLLLPLLLLLAPPPSERVAWMTPEAYHLSVGMKRAAAAEALRSWTPKPGSTPDEIVADFSGSRAVTLKFRGERLVSIRFELFVLLPESRTAFDEARRMLLAGRGRPRTSGPSVIVYDNRLPNILAAVADDPLSEQGKKGLGVVAIRYYDPRE